MDRTDRMENKLEKIEIEMTSQTIILADIRKDLSEHMRRTNLLEIELERQEDVMDELGKPIQWIKTTAKIITWCVPIVAGLASLWYYLQGRR